MTRALQFGTMMPFRPSRPAQTALQTNAGQNSGARSLIATADDSDPHKLSEQEFQVCRRMNLDPEKFAANKLKATSADGGSQPDDGLNLTAEQRDVCRKMRIDPVKFAENMRKSFNYAARL